MSITLRSKNYRLCLLSFDLFHSFILDCLHSLFYIYHNKHSIYDISNQPTKKARKQTNKINHGKSKKDEKICSGQKDYIYQRYTCQICRRKKQGKAKSRIRKGKAQTSRTGRFGSLLSVQHTAWTAVSYIGGYKLYQFFYSK